MIEHDRFVTDTDRALRLIHNATNPQQATVTDINSKRAKTAAVCPDIPARNRRPQKETR